MRIDAVESSAPYRIFAASLNVFPKIAVYIENPIPIGATCQMARGQKVESCSAITVTIRVGARVLAFAIAAVTVTESIDSVAHRGAVAVSVAVCRLAGTDASSEPLLFGA